jgi:hypothetical protein
VDQTRIYGGEVTLKDVEIQRSEGGMLRFLYGG